MDCQPGLWPGIDSVRRNPEETRLILSWTLLPLMLQGIVMGVDEFYFHRRRGLPLWERVGHPVDTLSVIACYGWLLWALPEPSAVPPYLGLCAFSCLLITKDEFVHSRQCLPLEQWLHSLLFVLHPICFLAAGWLWWSGDTDSLIKIQTALIFVFMIYQMVYWNLLWKPQKPLGKM